MLKLSKVGDIYMEKNKEKKNTKIEKKQEVKKLEENKKEVKKEKIIKPRNYIILILLFSLTMGLCFYIAKCYKVYSKSKLEIPILKDTVKEIKYADIKHFVSENPNSVIYVCKSDNIRCRDFEKKLKKYITSKDLNNEITYLNVFNKDNINVIKEINKDYNQKLKEESYPLFIAFKDGKVGNVLTSQNENLTIKKVESFFEIINLGE